MKAIPCRPSAPWNEAVPKVLIIWFRFLMQQRIPVLRVVIQSTFLLDPTLPLVWYAWALQCVGRCFVNQVDEPLSVEEGHRSLLEQIEVIGSLSRQPEDAINLFLIEGVCVLCQVDSILYSTKWAMFQHFDIWHVEIWCRAFLTFMFCLALTKICFVCTCLKR